MKIINVLLALMIVVSFGGATVLHECAHTLAASWLGDQTPRYEGRLSLNPWVHLDPLGTVLCLILAFQPIAFIFGMIAPLSVPPVGLGWGKPIKPDPWKMRVNANTGVLLVALAGPVFSFLLGLLMALVAHFVAPVLVSNFFTLYLLQFIVVFASVNIALALFNIIPLYPLDGYQILYTLLPSRQAVKFARWAYYGPFIILLFFFYLPFLVSLASPQLTDFFLFRIPYYLWLGAINLVSLIMGYDWRSLVAIYLH